MNHILLATTSRNDLACDFAGVNAMELLINGILKRGGVRNNLLAKAFGGASMIDGLSGIGQANCAFAVGFLEQENIPCVSKSLGGTTARHVVFTPTTGQVRVKAQTDNIITPVERRAPPASNGLELF
ncbi:putative chemoreceptor glutamine deamidase CheD [Sulfitobacter noctilucicola]|nr:putative chemoreceptor glutamine deamidase CheD [Sulfitobacter noctilucicola]